MTELFSKITTDTLYVHLCRNVSGHIQNHFNSIDINTRECVSDALLVSVFVDICLDCGSGAVNATFGEKFDILT